MSSFDTIVTDIRELKIQGAINIAKKALEAYVGKVESVKFKVQSEGHPQTGGWEAELAEAKAILIATRPTEPALRNLLDLYEKQLSADLSNSAELYTAILQKVEDDTKRIHLYGSNVIEDGMTILTHCHSSTVTQSIIRAFRAGKEFTVYNTETRPRFQGRKTALELAEAGIEVHHMVDSAAFHILRKVDLFLFGADAINSVGNVFNKVGTAMFAHLAQEFGAKTFSITGSLKYDHETEYGTNEVIEERDTKEVWEIPHPMIKIMNPAFDEVIADDITGIISEFGVMSPATFISNVNYET